MADDLNRKNVEAKSEWKNTKTLGVREAANGKTVGAEVAQKKLGRPKGTGKRAPGRPRKSAEVTPKHLVGAVKPKRGRPKGSGKPGRSKGSGRKAGRPKGKVGRPRAKAASKGLVGGLVAKQVTKALKGNRKQLKALVQGLVSKELKKALKAALR